MYQHFIDREIAGMFLVVDVVAGEDPAAVEDAMMRL